MKKVAVVVDFYSIDNAYSLCNVAGDQIRMLLRAGYSPRVLVDDHFPDPKEKPDEVPYPWDSVELFRLPSIPRSNLLELPDNWQSHLERMTAAMREGLKGIDIAFTHDVVYQPAQILYLMAMREILKERAGSLRAAHLVHSATAPALISTTNEYLQEVKKPLPYSVLCFPNAYSRPRLSRNFGYEEKDIRHTPHAIDFCSYFKFHPMTTRIVDEYNMLQSDVIICYPLRLDRGKNAEWVLYIAAGLKAIGRSVRVIIAAFHSTGGDKVEYKKWLYEEAHRVGLSDDEFVFTCDYDEELRVRCPREMIADFFQLSNVFIMPSRSESFSLITLEAGLAGNLIVLNKDFPPLRFWGEQHIYGKFSSNIDAMTGFDGNTDVSYSPSKEAYARDLALRIVAGLQNNVVIRTKTELRQRYNLDTIFSKYWEPIIYEA